MGQNCPSAAKVFAVPASSRVGSLKSRSSPQFYVAILSEISLRPSQAWALSSLRSNISTRHFDTESRLLIERESIVTAVIIQRIVSYSDERLYNCIIHVRPFKLRALVRRISHSQESCYEPTAITNGKGCRTTIGRAALLRTSWTWTCAQATRWIMPSAYSGRARIRGPNSSPSAATAWKICSSFSSRLRLATCDG